MISSLQASKQVRIDEWDKVRTPRYGGGVALCRAQSGVNHAYQVIPSAGTSM